MTETPTPYGRLVVGTPDVLFARAVEIAAAQHAKRVSRHFTWALSGGTTPQDWFRWVVARKALSRELIEESHFTVSDERMVPLNSDQSNFGNAERWLLSPLKVPQDHRHPWVVAYSPAEAAEAYRKTWFLIAGPGKAYDVCMLGMGDDAHTASFFPGTPLFDDDGGLPFAAVNAGERGWRLTLTPTGLRICRQIIVMALGEGKAEALRRVMRSEEPWSQVPAKILSTASDCVTWLVDEAAASKL
ncbi:MAG: 6-phosphogluconolactonase [Opitutaceae bacterium]